jgi:hypothetical protein
VVYPGRAAAHIDLGTDYISRFFKFGTPLPGASTRMSDLPLVLDQATDIGLWFSDDNFNVLAPTVKYSVEIGLGDPVTASLAGTPPMRANREEGFFFAQLYCDGSATSTCGMVCPPSPATQQCLVKSAVTEFEYGVAGSVRIKASSSLKGVFSVTGVATLPNSVAALKLSGEVK